MPSRRPTEASLHIGGRQPGDAGSAAQRATPRDARAVCKTCTRTHSCGAATAAAQSAADPDVTREEAHLARRACARTQSWTSAALGAQHPARAIRAQHAVCAQSPDAFKKT